MPNSQDINKYPILLFEAIGNLETMPAVVLQCSTPQRAKNLRSLLYTLRKLLAASTHPVHQHLASLVEGKKFYVDGAKLILADPMYTSIHDTTLEQQP